MFLLTFFEIIINHNIINQYALLFPFIKLLQYFIRCNKNLIVRIGDEYISLLCRITEVMRQFILLK